MTAVTREASAAMVALVEALSVASYAAGHAAGCDEYTADEERVASEAVDAPEDALLAAIAAQEAATEAAQAEVVRLRQIAVDARSRIAELTAEAAADPRRYPALAVTWLTWVATQIEGAALKEPT